MASIMCSRPLPRLMRPKVQITRRPASPEPCLVRLVAIEGNLGHSVRNDVDVRTRHAVDAGQQVGRRPSSSRRCRGYGPPGSESIGRGTGSGWVIKVWNVVTIGLRQARANTKTRGAPLAGIKAELMLQAHDIARSVVGHFGGEAIGVVATIIDDMDHARIVVASRGVFWIAANDRDGLPAARSTASAESLVNVASPHSSGG